MCCLCRSARACFFLFLPFFCPFVLPPAWRGWLSLIQVRRCSGFAHSWVTLAQQGRQPVSLVLLPYLAPKTAHRPSRGRIHFFSPERVYPPPLGGGAGYLLSWVRRVCPARSKLTHTGPTGLVWGFAGVVPLPGSQNRSQGRTGASLGFLTKTSLPLPLKGEGRGIVFLGLALLVHNWLTRAQQGLFGAALVSFPYLAVKTAHGGTRGRVWFSPPFPGTLLLRKSRKLALQVVIHRIVNGKDRVKQRPVSRSAVQCPHRCRQRFDEILVL